MNSTKHGGLAGFLSFIVPGLGQIYNRHYLKGILFFMVPLILWNIAYIFFPSVMIFGRGLFEAYWIATILAFIIRILSAVEAKRSANAINLGNDLGDFSFDQIKTKGIRKTLLNRYGILAILFLISIAWGMTTTNQTDFTFFGFEAHGIIVAEDSSFKLVDYNAAKNDVFVAKREDSSSYYGNWGGGEDANFTYDVQYRVNLSDIRWNITQFYSENKNVSESDIVEKVNENITDMITAAENAGNISVYVNAPYNEENLADDGLGFAKLNGDILMLNDTFTEYDIYDITQDITYTYTLELHDESGDKVYERVSFTVVIPKKNIDVKDPHVQMEKGQSGTVKKNY